MVYFSNNKFIFKGNTLKNASNTLKELKYSQKEPTY